MNRATVVVVGVGPGLGGAISQRFAAAGHPVAMAARTPQTIEKLAADIAATDGTARAFVLDATDQDAMHQMFDTAESAMGPVAVAIYNVGQRLIKSFLEIGGAELEEIWRVNCFGAFTMAQEAARLLVQRGTGSIFFTGAPSSRRGMADHAGFAVAKFGIRGMAESMAREFGPQGIHVAHFNVDGGVGNERKRKSNPELSANDGLISTAALAEAYYQTYLQPRDCWSFDVELRPWNRAF